MRWRPVELNCAWLSMECGVSTSCSAALYSDGSRIAALIAVFNSCVAREQVRQHDGCQIQLPVGFGIGLVRPQASKARKDLLHARSRPTSDQSADITLRGVGPPPQAAAPGSEVASLSALPGHAAIGSFLHDRTTGPQRAATDGCWWCGIAPPPLHGVQCLGSPDPEVVEADWEDSCR